MPINQLTTNCVIKQEHKKQIYMFSMDVELVSYLMLAIHMALLRTFQIFCPAEVFRMIFQFHSMPAAVQLHLQLLAGVLMQPVHVRINTFNKIRYE